MLSNGVFYHVLFCVAINIASLKSAAVLYLHSACVAIRRISLKVTIVINID